MFPLLCFFTCHLILCHSPYLHFSQKHTRFFFSLLSLLPPPPPPTHTHTHTRTHTNLSLSSFEHEVPLKTRLLLILQQELSGGPELAGVRILALLRLFLVRLHLLKSTLKIVFLCITLHLPLLSLNNKFWQLEMENCQ